MKKVNSEKLKVIINMSNAIIRDFYSEGNTEKEILKHVKIMVPQNPIEKRIIQRICCIVGGYIKIKEGKIVNKKIEYLLSMLRK